MRVGSGLPGGDVGVSSISRAKAVRGYLSGCSVRRPGQSHPQGIRGLDWTRAIHETCYAQCSARRAFWSPPGLPPHECTRRYARWSPCADSVQSVAYTLPAPMQIARVLN